MTAGLPQVAIRIPNHALTLTLLEKLNLPFRITQCLIQNNLFTIADLLNYSPKELQNFCGIGNFSLYLIQKKLPNKLVIQVDTGMCRSGMQYEDILKIYNERSIIKKFKEVIRLLLVQDIPQKQSRRHHPCGRTHHNFSRQ